MLRSFRRLFVVYKGYRLRLLFSQVLLLISATATIAVATLNQRLINDGLLAQDAIVILDTGIWMAVLAVVAGVTLAGTAYYAVFFAQGTAYVVRAELYDKIQTYSFANFDRFRTGNLIVRLNADVLNIANAVMYTVILLLYAPFMVIVAFILAYLRTPSLVWILAAVTVVVLAMMGILVPQIFKVYDERQQRLDDLNTTLQENLSGIRVVKAFVREALENARFEQRANAMRAPAFGAAFRVALLNPLLNAIGQIAVALTILIGRGSRC
jgi:ABC-type multidrug transport system fused ATPase/permease subunit